MVVAKSVSGGGLEFALEAGGGCSIATGATVDDFFLFLDDHSLGVLFLLSFLGQSWGDSNHRRYLEVRVFDEDSEHLGMLLAIVVAGARLSATKGSFEGFCHAGDSAGGLLVVSWGLACVAMAKEEAVVGLGTVVGGVTALSVFAFAHTLAPEGQAISDREVLGICFFLVKGEKLLVECFHHLFVHKKPFLVHGGHAGSV